MYKNSENNSFAKKKEKKWRRGHFFHVVFFKRKHYFFLFFYVAVAVRARARLLPSLLIKKWRSWVRALHKTVHSPAVGSPIPRLQVAMKRQGSPPPKGAMWDGVGRAPGMTKKILIFVGNQSYLFIETKSTASAAWSFPGAELSTTVVGRVASKNLAC